MDLTYQPYVSCQNSYPSRNISRALTCIAYGGLNDWRLFPVCNQSLIHILQAFEWQFATLDYMRMIEAGIGCKEYAVYIESAIHFLQTVLRQLQ